MRPLDRPARQLTYLFTLVTSHFPKIRYTNKYFFQPGGTSDMATIREWVRCMTIKLTKGMTTVLVIVSYYPETTESDYRPNGASNCWTFVQIKPVILNNAAAQNRHEPWENDTFMHRHERVIFSRCIPKDPDQPPQHVYRKPDYLRLYERAPNDPNEPVQMVELLKCAFRIWTKHPFYGIDTETLWNKFRYSTIT